MAKKTEKNRKPAPRPAQPAAKAGTEATKAAPDMTAKAKSPADATAKTKSEVAKVRPAAAAKSKPKHLSPAAAAEKTFLGLRRFNAIMGALHLVQGILMIVISRKALYPIYSSVLKFVEGRPEQPPALTEALKVNFGPAVAVFLLLSAVAHLCLATFGFKWYVEKLKKGMNPARFYEYALSSSLMIVLIAMLVGVQDLGALIALFGVNATMNLFGIVMELHNQDTKRTHWTSFVFGCVAGIVPWIVILMHFFGSIAVSGNKPPWFVYTIIPTIFVFFNIFAVNMYLQYKKIGRWRDYLFGERVYIILSLTAKTVLAWLIWFGTLRPL